LKKNINTKIFIKVKKILENSLVTYYCISTYYCNSNAKWGL